MSHSYLYVKAPLAGLGWCLTDLHVSYLHLISSSSDFKVEFYQMTYNREKEAQLDDLFVTNQKQMCNLHLNTGTCLKILLFEVEACRRAVIFVFLLLSLINLHL